MGVATLSPVSAHEIDTVLYPITKMDCSTVKTFSGLGSFSVEINCGSFSNRGGFTLRETETGDKLICEGITNVAVRDAVLLFVRSQESHKDKPEVRKFLSELSQGLTQALKADEAEWES